MDIVHPMGQADQIPDVPNNGEREKAKRTLMTKSQKVAAINCVITPPPRRTPSAINFIQMTK